MELKSALTKKRLVVIAAVIVIIASTAVFLYNFNGKSFDFSDRETRIVITDSMASNNPTEYDIGCIPVNSLVMIEKLSTKEKQAIQIGDVVSFVHTNGKYTIHRVIEVYTDVDGNVTGFKTMGDKYRSDPTPIHYEEPSVDSVIGKVVGESPTLGSIVHFAQTKTILLALMVVIVIVMVSVVFDIVKIRRGSGPEGE